MSGPWLLAVAVALAFGLLGAFENFDELEYFAVSLIVAAILVWPLHWAFAAIDAEQDARDARRAAAVSAWVDTMTKAGCKRTSYLAKRTATIAVWTCPDGVAHLQNQGGKP